MLFFFMALLAAAIGCLPLFFKRGTVAIGGIATAALTVILSGIFYLYPPALGQPFYGSFGIWAGLLLTATGFIIAKSADEPRLYLVPIAVLVIFGARGFAGNEMVNASKYAGLIGEIKELEWTDTTQPKDPKHVRLVPKDLAIWLANKQLGEAPGALGSQFTVDNVHMTLQLINDEMWYVAPLEFRGYSVWSSAVVTPGYVKVSGEDPNRPAELVIGRKFAYTPDAFFDANLFRHVWNNGYASFDQNETNFEIDDEGKPWWVVTLTKPSVGWWGDKIEGVLVINPETGAITRLEENNIPEWIDRVMPETLVDSYVDLNGSLSGGWINSWWHSLNLTEGQKANFVHGSDGQPYWVTEITSNSLNDSSLVGMMYVNARTGAATYYRSGGGTIDEGVLQAVNAKVAYRKWHGSDPTLYNLYGTMASIVPLLADGSNTFQGVAIVNIVAATEVAVGESFEGALREYQKLLGKKGGDAAPELAREVKTLEGALVRFAAAVGEQGTTYYLIIGENGLIFTGGPDLSPELPLAKADDKVRVEYFDSPETVVPMLTFDNLSITLRKEK